jgi:hypothetical protein
MRWSSPSSLAPIGLALAVAFAPVSASGEKKSAPRDPPRPTTGTTYEYPWDGRDIGHPERAWTGRAYVHPDVAAEPKKPVPLIVFIHGLNRELIKNRWMGGGVEGDLRRIVQDLIDKKAIVPAIVAGPGSIVESTVSDALTAWPAFDVDNFIARTQTRLQDVATIDTSRIVVVGHSGAGCNDSGGLATVAQSKTHLLGLISVDTCMGPGLARKLVGSPADTHVIVSWQAQTWTDRPFTLFKNQFKHDLKAASPPPTALRELDPIQVKEGFPHDAMVHLALEKWLPKILSP